ncbi:MAG TPA: S-adenosylmethionine:tRNA ribosyltransferase-isomerase [Candidatus Eisenbacteria bacterium]|nr:S-adenosylmethionine:tRNA ribosyltransferase-isomerase [Candidatus Eisenbacteria bacterium]
MSLRTSDFDFELPPERIAQHPAPRRDGSRLLVLDRASGGVRHVGFRDLPSLLRQGDLLVVNDTRVIPARLLGRLRRGAIGAIGAVGAAQPGSPEGSGERDVEIFLLREEPAVRPERIWTTLARPARALQVGAVVHFADPAYSAHVLGTGERGVRHVAFRPAAAPRRIDPDGQLAPGQVRTGTHSRTTQRAPGTVRTANPLAPGQVVSGKVDTSAAELAPGQVVSFETWLSRVGHIPLPPYIDRPDEPEDRERYQTIFARDPGSVAAPTAGLHFTDEVTDALRALGVTIATVTLHVGPGTFRPVATENPAEHVLDSEPYRVPPETVAAIRAARERRHRAVESSAGPATALGNRIVAVGTTAVRTLESWALAGEPDDGAWRETGLFILPPFDFRVIDGMITNFHLPKSSLLMLVSALAGREPVLDAYREAVAREYRFYSYGDAMLIL